MQHRFLERSKRMVGSAVGYTFADIACRLAITAQGRALTSLRWACPAMTSPIVKQMPSIASSIRCGLRGSRDDAASPAITSPAKRIVLCSGSGCQGDRNDDRGVFPRSHGPPWERGRSIGFAWWRSARSLPMSRREFGVTSIVGRLPGLRADQASLSEERPFPIPGWPPLMNRDVAGRSARSEIDSATSPITMQGARHPKPWEPMAGRGAGFEGG